MRERNDGPGLTQAREGASRRDFVKVIGAAVLGAGAAPLSLATPVRAQTGALKAPEGGFRFVFMPDTHLRREYRAAEGLAAALQAAERLNPRPAFFMTGGDLCHDLRGEDLEDARALADQFAETGRRNTSIPTYHMLGNHDAAGWGEGDVPEDHPDYRFGLMQRVLDLGRRYYSFDQGGWHFVIVDNIRLTEPGSHIGWVDEEQLVWLRDDLHRNRERPTMVAMHVPPVTSIEFLSDRGERDTEENEWRIGFDRKSGNPEELIEALNGGNVRAVLSGHIHLVERIDMMGQTFLCLGSVSGQQWMGPRQGFRTAEGFGVIDVRPDGTYDWNYQSFGWQAPPEALEAQRS
ncbi:MAG: metallophosphoesterase [Gemmatimonadetes bacterium]|nr:metallophosphoesterase [Gemmatimonadota bacterium]